MAFSAPSISPSSFVIFLSRASRSLDSFVMSAVRLVLSSLPVLIALLLSFWVVLQKQANLL